MFRKFLVICLLLISQSALAETPTCNLPYPLRYENYDGGSCVHASTESAFMWANMPKSAAFWRANYSGGENSEGLAYKMDRNGIRYASVLNGDPEFLKYAMRTRRMVIIEWGGNHMVNLVHFDGKWAGILNNNHTSTIKWMPAAQFVKEWNYYGGWAVVLLYDPAPPLPARSK